MVAFMAAESPRRFGERVNIGFMLMAQAFGRAPGPWRSISLGVTSLPMKVN